MRLGFLLTLVFVCTSSATVYDFTEFKRLYAPESTSPLPPSTSVLIKYSKLTEVEKYFFLEKYFQLSKVKKVATKSLLVRATPVQLRQLLAEFPSRILRSESKLNLVEISVPKFYEVDEFFEKVQNRFPAILIEKNLKLELYNSFESAFEDKSFPYESYFETFSGRLPINIRDYRVCVIDTGIEPHEDLPLITVDRSDSDGHGTHVAGILAGIRGNQKGVKGIAKLLSISSYQAIGNPLEGTLMDLLTAMEQGRREQCKLFNLSLGFPGYSRILYETLSEYGRQGLILVAAAGNSGTDQDVLPASHPMVIGVGSFSTPNKISDFSNRGNNLLISLPGEDIYSTSPGNSYSRKSGTSMAAPILTGIIAMYNSRLRTPVTLNQWLDLLEFHGSESNKSLSVTHRPLLIERLLSDMTSYLKLKDLQNEEED